MMVGTQLCLWVGSHGWGGEWLGRRGGERAAVGTRGDLVPGMAQGWSEGHSKLGLRVSEARGPGDGLVVAGDVARGDGGLFGGLFVGFSCRISDS